MAIETLRLTGSEMDTMRRFVKHVAGCNRCKRPGSLSRIKGLCGIGASLGYRAAIILSDRPAFTDGPKRQQEELW